MASKVQHPWLSPRKASIRLGVSEMMVYKLAVLGRLRVLVEPGENVRFAREDVERLAVGRKAAPPLPS